MDSSEKESGGEPTSILGLSEDDHGNQNISYEVGSALGTQRLHLEREPTVDIEEGSFSQQLTWITDKGIKMETNSEDEAEGSDSSCAMTRSNSYDELVRGGIMLKPSSPETTASPDSTRHFNSGDLQISVEEEEEVKDHAVVIHHMDIKEPLSTLRRSLEAVHNFNLEGYHFYLQNETQDEPSLQCQSSQILSPLPQDYCEQVLYIPSDSVMREYGSPTEPTDLHVSFQHALDMELYQFVPSLLSDDRSLEDQCHPGCGTVQINLEVKVMDDKKMLNIIDVLMPSDSYLQSTGNAEFNLVQSEEVSQSNVSGDQDDKDAIRWTIDKNFKESQQRLQIPEDPVQWDVPQVLHWLVWAVRQFNLTGIDLADWRMTGAELCNLTLEEFQVRVPCDPFDIFWTHLELLRRCKMVAVMLDPITKLPRPASAKTREESDIAGNKNIMRTRDKKPKFVKNNNKTSVIVENSVLPLNGWIRSTGNNGQVQLWQFLLDLLTDKNHREVIQWLGGEGEFKLMDPERVAYLWGQRKNKPSMNYEKLSRALRYYYDGDMIAKVSGKRFVYKFVCDLKQLLGYSAFELNSRVIDAELRAQNAANDPPPLQHSIFRNP